jgi:hypothetical protein
MGVQVNGLYRNGDEKSPPRSILERQFISFSYDEKDIEEFGLVVVFNGQGLDKEIYASFQDITTEQEELNGQLFWRSKFNANKLSFTLATDGMTVQQLERFKFHFRPGYNKELILSEHHNRAILARVASAPRMKLTPFEHGEKITVGGNKYPIITTLYKGEISLDFVMDEPYWYSKLSYVDELNEENLKLIYEDNLPLLEDLKEKKCFLANGKMIGSPTSTLYYCGTAPANPILSFDITVSKNEDYKTLSFEKNGVDDLNEPYIKIGEDKYLRFGLPSIFTSYNYVLEAIKNCGLGSSFLEVRKAIQAVAFDYYTRAYALQILEQFNKASGKIEDSSFQENFRNDFSNFFKGDKLHCNINNQTGTVTISCAVANSEEEITEKAGNMIKSNYLIIEPSEDKYQNISSNVKISNLIIDYKYMYL